MITEDARITLARLEAGWDPYRDVEGYFGGFVWRGVSVTQKQFVAKLREMCYPTDFRVPDGL